MAWLSAPEEIIKSDSLQLEICHSVGPWGSSTRVLGQTAQQMQGRVVEMGKQLKQTGWIQRRIRRQQRQQQRQRAGQWCVLNTVMQRKEMQQGSKRAQLVATARAEAEAKPGAVPSVPEHQQHDSGGCGNNSGTGSSSSGSS